MKVSELLSDKEKWIKGNYARNASNHVVNMYSPEATCWCLSGAMYKCRVSMDRRAEVNAYIRNKYPERVCHLVPDDSVYVAWNDHPLTTYSEVIELVNELDL